MSFISNQSSFVDAPDGSNEVENEQFLIVNNNDNTNSFISENSFVDAPDGSNDLVNKQLLEPKIILNNNNSIISNESSFVDAPDSLNEVNNSHLLEPELNNGSISLISDQSSFVDAPDGSINANQSILSEVSDFVDANDGQSSNELSLNIVSKSNKLDDSEIKHSVDDLANKSSIDAFEMTLNTPISPIFERSSIIELVEQERIFEDNDQINSNEEKLNNKILDEKIRSDLEINNSYVKEE